MKKIILILLTTFVMFGANASTVMAGHSYERTLINNSGNTWKIYKCDTGHGNLWVNGAKNCELNGHGDTCILAPHQSYKLTYTSTGGDVDGSFTFFNGNTQYAPGATSGVCYDYDLTGPVGLYTVYISHNGNTGLLDFNDPDGGNIRILSGSV